jgi:hypothetical protein
MAQALLVNVDIGAGSEILNILDRAKVKISVALWAHLSEYEDWRMILAGRQFDALPTTMKAFRLLNDTVRAAGFPIENRPPVMILPMTSPFIKALRRAFSKARTVEGMRLGGQLFGDRFVEDGYVYRIS